MKIEKVEKVIANLHDKNEYVVLIRNSKQALNHKAVLKKVYRVIKFNQKPWLKPDIDIKTVFRKATKRILKMFFSKLTNNSVFGKTMENVQKHRDIKLVQTEK